MPGLVPGVGAPFPVGAVSPEALTTCLSAHTPPFRNLTMV